MKPLNEEQVYRQFNIAELGFVTTKDLPLLSVKSNQHIPLAALKMGLTCLPKQNLFICNGSDQQMIAILQECINSHSSPGNPMDICYGYNFIDAEGAELFLLPANSARSINADLKICISVAFEKLQHIIDSNEYVNAIQEIRDLYHRHINRLIGDFRKKMHSDNIELGHSAKGYSLAGPSQQNESLSLANAELLSLKTKIASLERQEYIDIHEYNLELVNGIVNPLLQDVRRRCSVEKLNQHYESMINHICDQLPNMGTKDSSLLLNNWINTYLLNILVEQNDNPAIEIEINPTEKSLFGSSKYEKNHNGDKAAFQYIRAGKIHKATGGYLIIRLDPLSQDKVLWKKFKQIMHQTYFEDENHASCFPIDFRILLVGNKDLYCNLLENDSEFADLAVMLVEFDDELPINQDNIKWYCQLIATLAEENTLNAFTVSAVARLMEYSSAYIEEQNRLSLENDILVEIMIQANYLAATYDVDKSHVEQAIVQKRDRDLLAQRNYLQQIQRDLVLLDTEGQKIGQINGLAVITSGGVTYGMCCRISAAVRMGDGDFLDIEREVELGGSLHSKGVLILTNYVGARYSRNQALSIAASLVFEQSYGGIDGDSASLAELCVLLSAIGHFPVKQEIAITGSVNQLGEVQSIGAVNEKIEGFFRVCKLKGLTGKQGVIIPFANQENLVLDGEVRQAIKDGLFSVYPVKHVDMALTILTDRIAGEAVDGQFPNNSINAQIYKQLDTFTQKKNTDKE